MEEHLAELPAQTKGNVLRFFKLGRLDLSHVASVSAPIPWEKGGRSGVVYRVEFDGHFQRGTASSRTDARPISGMHGTTPEGACAILKSRMLKPGPELDHGVYFLGACNLTTSKEKVDLWFSCHEGKKDYSGVVYELSGFAHVARSHRSDGTALVAYDSSDGGTYWDADVCKLGECAHFKASSENRYCLPPRRINLEAMWIHTYSLEDVAKVTLF